MLERYDWPGNVRELRNTVERMAILTPGDRITVDSIPLEIRMPHASATDRTFRRPATRPSASTFFEALEETNWNVSGAARVLGMERTNLHKRIRALGLNREDEGGWNICRSRPRVTPGEAQRALPGLRR